MRSASVPGAGGPAEAVRKHGRTQLAHATASSRQRTRTASGGNSRTRPGGVAHSRMGRPKHSKSPRGPIHAGYWRTGIMLYSAEITRANPSCFLFVVDQSASMLEVAHGHTKAQAAADVINRSLWYLVIKCTKSKGVRDYYQVGVLGYGGSVASAFSGALAGRDLVPVSEIANAPVRIEDRYRKVQDGAGALVEERIRLPIWFDAVGNNGAPMCSALNQAHGILSRWLD